MSETVTRDALVKFVEGVISCFCEEYLRRPNQDDLARLLHVGEERGFPGMLLHRMTYGYDMHSSEHRVHAMILTSSKDLIFLMMSWQV
uniref:Uncharacterized protein n=1 Tax=Lactuca sativa TaxID=4236 RepID=A0A9R1WYA1_LACSA|nr:hypothetical protein LSAT_V11C800436380 [Lactuca sativa]